VVVHSAGDVTTGCCGPGTMVVVHSWAAAHARLYTLLPLGGQRGAGALLGCAELLLLLACVAHARWRLVACWERWWVGVLLLLLLLPPAANCPRPCSAGAVTMGEGCGQLVSLPL
jgi:hypothetical protein